MRGLLALSILAVLGAQPALALEPAAPPEAAAPEAEPAPAAEPAAESEPEQPAAESQPEQPAAAAIAAPTAAQSPSAPAYIEPQNSLEQSFISAVDNPDLRAAFRREFLESQVALALSSRDPSAPPREIDLPDGAKACLIFTSPARAAAIMGDDAPYVMLTGRDALERLRGTNVVINVNLRPYLLLDSEGVDGFLSIPAPPAAPEAPAPPPEPSSAGPTQ